MSNCAGAGDASHPMKENVPTSEGALEEHEFYILHCSLYLKHVCFTTDGLYFNTRLYLYYAGASATTKREPIKREVAKETVTNVGSSGGDSMTVSEVLGFHMFS